MTEPNDLEVLAHVGTTAPPLPAALERRTFALARAHLPLTRKRPWSLRFADYAPPPILVPALLGSAAVVFAIDAFVALARFFPAWR